MSDKLIEAFLQMHDKKQIENIEEADNIFKDKGLMNPSSMAARIRYKGSLAAGKTKPLKPQGTISAEPGNYTVNKLKDKAETFVRSATGDLGDVVGLTDPKRGEGLRTFNPGAAQAGDLASIATTLLPGKGALQTAGIIGKSKQAAGVADDISRVAKGIDGEVTTAMPRSGYKDITPSSSTAVARTGSEIKPTTSTGPSTSLNRPNSSSVGPAMKTVDEVPPRLTGPAAARALPSASDTSKALGGFGKVPMGKVAAVGAGVGAGIAASTLGSSPAGETKAASAPAPETPKPESYKVSKGDTLSDLAKKWNVSVADIAKSNQGIKDVHKIGVGQELVKPTATKNPIYQYGIGTKAGPQNSQNMIKPKTESTEMSNKLIDAFMQLHSTNSSNLFAEAKKAKKLDPVGKEDEDIDNDGDKDKSDSYLHNRRKAIKAAMKEAKDPYGGDTTSPSSMNIKGPDYAEPKKKPAGGNSKVIQTGPNSSTVTKSTNEEVEQIDEALTAAHKAAIAKHVGKMWGKKGNISFSKEGGKHFVSHSDGIDTHVHSIDMKKGVPHVTHFMTMQEEVEELDEISNRAKSAYLGKAVADLTARAQEHGYNVGKKKKNLGDNARKISNRQDGIYRATKGMREDVEFSEAELAHIAAILEANPVAPVPDDYSGAANGVSKRDLSDETVAEEEMKRGRGRPKGSKSGSKHGASGDGGVETKNLAAQIRHSRPSGGNFTLKHPTTGETKSVSAKAATEFYNKYTSSEKPAQKQAHHDEFLAKHFGSSEKPKTGITLPSMPKPRS